MTDTATTTNDPAATADSVAPGAVATETTAEGAEKATGQEAVAEGAPKPLLTGEGTAEGSDSEKPDAEQTAEGDKDGAEEGPPDEYGKFTIPDGIEIDQTRMDQATALFRELGLTQSQAQKLVDMEVQATQAVEKAQAEAHKKLIERYHQDVRRDNELGGDNYDNALKIANIALSKFATPQLINDLTITGWGSHPELVRLFYRIGVAVSDDSVDIPTAGDTGGPQRTAAVLFDKSNMQ